MNPGPNKTMERLGFQFVKRHVTIPAGWQFQLEVNRWELTLEDFRNKYL